MEKQMLQIPTSQRQERALAHAYCLRRQAFRRLWSAMAQITLPQPTKKAAPVQGRPEACR